MKQVKRQRSCIACGKKANKMALLRIVKDKEGKVFVDSSGKAAGRGAYVCSFSCVAKATKTKKLERALKTKLSTTDFERIATEASSALHEG